MVTATEEAIRETLRERVDLAIEAMRLGKEMVSRVTKSVRESIYLNEEERNKLLTRLTTA